MKPRVTRTAMLAGAVLLPLAFGPLMTTFEDTGQHLDDGKARALATVADDGHARLDAAKQAHIELAMEEAELFADQAIPSAAECTDGFAGPYPCENVDLAAVVPLAELGGVAGNDSWGWTDPETGQEIAIAGTGTGVAFVDISEPTSPVVLGRVESEHLDRRILWRDVKVDGNYAFIVAEVRDHGMQVFDLTRLREATGNPPMIFAPDAVYEGFGSAHNIAINEDSDTAYGVGTNTCNGGLHMVDISDPTNPVASQQGEDGGPCYASDGYTHDVQCVLYDGPDRDYQGEDICFAANEDTVTIVNITGDTGPELVAKVGYETAGYTHQGRLTPDGRWFVFNDELDEDPILGAGTVQNTTTYMLNVGDLDIGFVPEGGPSDHPRAEDTERHGAVFTDSDGNPLVKAYSHDTVSIDHNLEIVGNLIWEANYNAGLRVLSYTEESLADGQLTPVGFFDVDPGVDVKAYGDSWNVYPYFASGTVIVSNLGQGLIVLRPDWEAMGYEPYEDGGERGRSEDKRKDGDRRPDGNDDRPGRP
ncbi:MAG: choice-of-anchor B family protein [Actinobacteria bacterium]|nr:choice-of-anchor B family protein [Actinomycetota bacterium]